MTFGARLGAKAAESTLNFASLLTQTIHGKEAASSEEAQGTEEPSVGDTFKAALSNFDQFLKNAGIAPEQVRTVEYSSDLHSWQVNLNKDSLDLSQQESVDRWTEQYPQEAQALNLS